MLLALPGWATVEATPSGVEAAPSSSAPPLEAALAAAPGGPHAVFERGDVFVAVGLGKVHWYLPDGTLNMVLDTGSGSEFTTGMAFNDRGHLFVTGFADGNIYEFDTSGTLLGVFYSTDGVTDCLPESIVFN